VRALTDDRIRLLFSPLGTVISLLEQHRFNDATSELDRIKTSAEHRSRQEDSQELLVKSHLQASLDLIAQVPLDLKLVRRSWEWALREARVIGIQAQAVQSIAQMSLARGAALFERRSRAQRQSDHDKRSLLARRHEAIGLETLAWELTKDSKVQSSLINHLERQAARLFENGDFDACAEQLFAALAVDPSVPDVAMTLAKVLRKRRRSKLEEGAWNDAGAVLKDAIDRLRKLDPKSEVEGIQQSLAQLNELGPIPFLEQVAVALQNGDWETAVDLMVWALRVSCANEVVEWEAYNLYRELSLCVEHGRNDLQDRLAYLKENMPQRDQEGSVLG
jgi:hypothetical protein